MGLSYGLPTKIEKYEAVITKNGLPNTLWNRILVRPLYDWHIEVETDHGLRPHKVAYLKRAKKLCLESAHWTSPRSADPLRGSAPSHRAAKAQATDALRMIKLQIAEELQKRQEKKEATIRRRVVEKFTL
jgi:hypothetical protein